MFSDPLSRPKKDRIVEAIYPIWMAYRRLKSYPKWKTERSLEAGRQVMTSQARSLLFFTTHRCASTFTGNLLDRFSQDGQMARANFDSYFTLQEKDVEAAFEEKDFQQNAFLKKGVIYGPFRSYRPIPGIEDYGVLLVLRDPRDILVSTYYSLAYSHSIMNKKLIRRRRKARGMTIDEFVLDEAARVRQIFEDYQNQLLGRSNVTYWTYADLITDPRGYLKSLVGLVDTDVDEEELDRIADAEMGLPDEEDRTRHKRSGRTRQFEEKLEPGTVKDLTAEFSQILDPMGFEE